MPARFLILPLAVLAIAGCNTETGGGTAAVPPADGAGDPLTTTSDSNRSPGKPTAPVDIRYRVLGTPIVGQPVAIELDLVSPLEGRQMRMSYAINDPDSLVFAESQPREIEIRIAADEGRAARQVTVVPQREGRLYLNVTVEVDTDGGSVLKSMSIPMSVGYSDAEPVVNGELRETADGDTVVSMPAAEN